MRRHTLGKILAVVAAAAVLITAVVITNAVAANAEFEDKLTSARGAVKALGQAEIHNNAQKIALDAEITRTQDTSAAVATIVAGAPAYFDTSAAADLEQARLALDAAVTAVKTPPAEGQPAASWTGFCRRTQPCSSSPRSRRPSRRPSGPLRRTLTGRTPRSTPLSKPARTSGARCGTSRTRS
ncbi:hypothetical protein IFU11_19580 [Plantibacter sp. CFBP 8804]|nr:hypothetical protein [Plantibacter sp. CFBP 8804]